MTAFSLSYDYRCPFAKNIHLHVVTALRAGAPFEVTFAPWSLSQGHRAEGAVDVWDDPAYDGDLVALAAGVSVRDQQPELFLDAHEALFRARHEQGRRLKDLAEVLEVLGPLGVDTERVADDITSRRPHEVIAHSHERFARVEAFGVPTFVVGDDATFVRYMDPPSSDAGASVRLITTLVSMIADQAALNEFKHTRLPA